MNSHKIESICVLLTALLVGFTAIYYHGGNISLSLVTAPVSIESTQQSLETVGAVLSIAYAFAIGAILGEILWLTSTKAVKVLKG